VIDAKWTFNDGQSGPIVRQVERTFPTCTTSGALPFDHPRSTKPGWGASRRGRRICHAGLPPQTAKRWLGFRHKPRNQNLCGEIRL